MIDDLKGLCQTNGLSNSAAEENIITGVFLYKFLNDRFMANLNDFANEFKISVDEIKNNENYMAGFYDSYPTDVAFTYSTTIEYLINKTSDHEFYRIFDDALESISKDPRNFKFGVARDDGSREPLFTRLTETVESSKRNVFARNIFSIISMDKFDFSDAFKENFDFYSAIFEYLIKDYNVASGVYAEYFTPQSIAYMNAKILVGISDINEDQYYDIYDPAAGSGSLVLHLAHELGHGKFGNKSTVYTQDISRKSSRFLRINLLLNGLTESLENLAQSDTLRFPAHHVDPDDINSSLRKYDLVTSNPPFKTDFSNTRDLIENDWIDTDRFFAGIPKIPKKKKKSMAIYLMFIQHIIWSLKEDGKAAVVVPTGFLTAKTKIEKTIREKLIDDHWLDGVVSMPSNVFANTGTNVSILYFDKANQNKDVILIDASKLGKKIKEGNKQKTILRDFEATKIIDTFLNRKEEDDFSVIVPFDDIKEKNYSFSAGQYFEIKIEHVDITAEEFEAKMDEYKQSLSEKFKNNLLLEKEILKNIEGLKYE